MNQSDRGAGRPSLKTGLWLSVPIAAAGAIAVVTAPTLPRIPASTPVACCFAPDATPSEEQLAELNHVLTGWGERYNFEQRWAGTMGSPKELRWSLVPDGLTIPAEFNGEPTTGSTTFATLDAAFGSRQAWLSVVQSCFDRWQVLTGVSFVFVHASGQDWDDGLAWGFGGGSSRGDIRIGMKTIDGTNNILAYAKLPANGDIVLDSAEIWDHPDQGYLYLRNALMHEIGHSLGLLHVCPTENTKLLEPFISLAYDGPQHDDIRAIMEAYGDPNEPDDSVGEATPLGALTPGLGLSVGTTIPAPVPPNSSSACIEGTGDQDWFTFTVASSNTPVRVTLEPVGYEYDDSDQSLIGACFSGNMVDSSQVGDLAVQLYRNSGTTLVSTADGAGPGETEVISATLSFSGTYQVRVYSTTSQTDSQMYVLRIIVNNGCLADMNGDGIANGVDVGLFLNAYSSGSLAADLNDDGVLNGLDVGVFLQAYFEGC